MDTIHQGPRKQNLGHLLSGVSRLVGSRMRKKMEAIGLHHGQGMVLFHLWREDGMAQKVLAEALHITPPTATSTLQRMERDGWIERRRDPLDQRVVRVYLTDKALALRTEARLSLMELDRELTSVLSDKERDGLIASLVKVFDHLSKGLDDSDGCFPRKQAQTKAGGKQP